MGGSNVLQVPDYETYLALGAEALIARYVRVERELANKRLEYAQVSSDEKRQRAIHWQEAVANGSTPTTADRYAENNAVHYICETILMRAELEILIREAEMLRVLKDHRGLTFS